MQRIVANLDAGDGCLLDKARISLTWSGQLYIIASRIILGSSYF